MSLSCSCGEWDGDGWGYYEPTYFTKLQKARTICTSCKKSIKISEKCLKFDRIEINEYGDEIDLLPCYMCKECGEIYLNLSDLGYCLIIIDNMHEYLNDYHILTGFKK